MTLRLDSLRECLEGIIPGHIVTCDPGGMPNVAFLSQAEYVDNEHIALSYQFFNTTRRNVLAGSPVRLLLTSHLTARQYRLSLQYLRTETAGPLFERMKAKLAGIAAHSGMAGIFRLLGADIYRVLDIAPVPGGSISPPQPAVNCLNALRRSTDRLGNCANLECLLEKAVDCLEKEFGINHLMLLMHDEARGCLFTLASRGYAQSGIGSEIPVGSGLIGICARERSPIRIGFMTSEYAYGRTVRDGLAAAGQIDALETAIPLPGLPNAASQMAIPIVADDRLLGVIYVESLADLHFGYDEEDALVVFAGHLGLAMLHHQITDETPDETPVNERPPVQLQGTPLTVRHFATNDSIFLDDDYLIKGVAGAILWALLDDFTQRGRTSFTNKGLRVDSRIRLPGASDNLEARLVLLQRRLAERNAGIAIDKTGRGRFTLTVERPLTLAES
ncbi:GAF domain-containing protein [Propionivibrio sp.]|uniref:GAF domain-containing protein n=1 Tax=Propionivibrio sp. TaxID=2212460 RepID=UPI00272E7A95|nr:GAF domain-containing protein [Propionivibrio sp.]